MDLDELLQYIEQYKELLNKQKHSPAWLDGADTALAYVYNRVCVAMQVEVTEDDDAMEALRDHVESLDE